MTWEVYGRGLSVAWLDGEAAGAGGGSDPPADAAKVSWSVLTRSPGGRVFDWGQTSASQEPAPEPQERTRRGGGSRFVQARKRLAMQHWWDYLTEEEPTAETKRVIAEIKAGRPIPDSKPPKGPDNISAEKLAAKIIPSRLWAAQNLIAENVDVQRVVAKALRIAQERDDEDILLLL